VVGLSPPALVVGISSTPMVGVAAALVVAAALGAVLVSVQSLE
jgi:hypothetical protein